MKNIAYHMLDIVQNSLRARAKLVEIDLVEDDREDMISLCVSDDGKGMEREILERVVDPYYTSRKSRNVGLGLPLLKQNAERTGGSFKIESTPGKGTRVEAHFVKSHLDLPGRGDLKGTVHQIIVANPLRNFVFRYTCNQQGFVIDTREIKDILEDWPLDHPKISGYIRELITEYFNQVGQNQTDSVIKHT